MSKTQGLEAILDRMCREITSSIGERLRADRTTIFFFDADENEFWSIIENPGEALEIRILADRGIVDQVFARKQSVNIPYDFYEDPRSAAAQEVDRKTGYRTYSVLAMPILTETGELLAVVQLLNKLKGSEGALSEKIDSTGFSSQDEDWLAQEMPSIRLTLTNCQSLYAAIEQQRVNATLMKAINSLNQGGMNLDEIIIRTIAITKEMIHCDRACLWIADGSNRELWTKIQADKFLKEIRIPMGEGFAGEVAIAGESLHIPFDIYDRADVDNIKKSDHLVGYRTCSLLVVPIFDRDRQVIGVMQLVNKKTPGDFPPYNATEWPEVPECWQASFTRSDRQTLETFGIQVGLVIEKAREFAKLQQKEKIQGDILRSISHAIILTDENGKIITVNESAKKMLGVSDNEGLEGRSVIEVIRLKEGDFSEWVRTAIANSTASDLRHYYPQRTLLSADDTPYSIDVSLDAIVPPTDPTRVTGLLVVMDDIADSQRIKRMLYRYMTPEAADKLLQTGERQLGLVQTPTETVQERKEVSLLFSGIRSFTNLLEHLEDVEVMHVLGEYFESMTDAVFKYDGTIDKYIGDTIVAVFGWPISLADHAWSSVRTAIEMHERLVQINQRRQAENQPILKAGIGINSDTAIVGNIGSSQRMEFTTIGEGVTIASLMERASKQYGCDIILSQNTYELCSDRIWTRELDRICIKEKTQPVTIYELIGLRSNSLSDRQQQLMEYYHKGREHYLNRQYAKALTEFGKILEINHDDKPAAMHIERCQHFLETSPPDDWNGVWFLIPS